MKCHCNIWYGSIDHLNITYPKSDSHITGYRSWLNSFAKIDNAFTFLALDNRRDFYKRHLCLRETRRLTFLFCSTFLTCYRSPRTHSHVHYSSLLYDLLFPVCRPYKPVTVMPDFLPKRVRVVQNRSPNQYVVKSDFKSHGFVTFVSNLTIMCPNLTRNVIYKQVLLGIHHVSYYDFDMVALPPLKLFMKYWIWHTVQWTGAVL